MPSPRTVSFSAPDVRKKSSIDLEAASPDYPSFWCVKEGVNYEGRCTNRFCSSRKKDHTICHFGFGYFRPNEQECYDEIKCLACGSKFEPECYLFKKCSAKVNFCLEGKRPDKICLSEDRDHTARKLGEYRRKVTYSMLVIEVERPGSFPDDDLTDTVELMRDMSIRQKINDRGTLRNVLSAVHTGFLNIGGGSQMDPREIFYCQDSIGHRFQCGRSVRRTMEELMAGTLSVFEIPTIRVFEWNGEWHTEDNRRLWAYKKAGLSSVPVKKISRFSVDERKFTTRNGGTSIEMR